MSIHGDDQPAPQRERESDARAHARRLRAVALAASGVVGAASFTDLKAVLRDACGTVLDFDLFALALYDEETDTLEVLAAEEAGVPRSVRASALAGTPSLQAIQSGTSLHINRLDDPRRAHARMIGDELKVPESLIISPILSGSTPLGVLSVQSYEPAEYDRFDVEVLEILASLAASAIKNVRLSAQRSAWERALRASHERLESLVSASPVAIITLDPGGRVETWNPAAERMLGMPAPAMRSKRFAERFPDLGAVFAELQRHSDAGSPVLGIEAVYEREDGRTVELAISCAPLEKPSVRAAETLYMVVDISDRKEAEAALRESEERFRHAQKMEAVGRLAGGVAHDFNNLLTAIMGNAELVLAEVDGSEEAREGILEIRDAAERAARLTRQLLAFSRRQISSPRTIGLNDIVRQMVPMLKRLINEDIYLRTDLADDLYPVRADPAHVEQIVMNLVLNARDAMPEGGCIEISTWNAQLTEAEVGRFSDNVPAGCYAALAVDDDGEGMPREVLEQAFEPFFTTKRLGEGTGLGLSTVYGTVRQSGGCIEAQSTQGEGTRFTIFLPMTEAETAPPRERRPRLVEGETVLLVEDEPAVRSFARKVLTRAGYTVHEAADGEEGRRLLADGEHDFDLLVTDVVMPQMSGPKMVSTMRRAGIDIPVLFITGYSEQALDRYGVSDGHAEILLKPFAAEALLEKVRGILDT